MVRIGLRKRAKGWRNGIGMQTNHAYIARAILKIFGAMRCRTHVCLVIQYVTFVQSATFYADVS